MGRWKSSSFLLGASVVVTVTVTLLLPAFVHGQGYGALNDDDDFASAQMRPQNNKFPQNQDISALPQYDSVEQQGQGPQTQPQPQQPAAPPQQPPPQQQPPSAPAQPGTDGPSGPSNMWWQGQNAFQRPPGHPGVEHLAPNTNAIPGASGGPGPQPQSQPQPQPQPAPAPTPNFNQPTPNNYNAYGGGAPPSAPQQQPQPQFNNPPQNQPQPQFNAPPQNQGFNNPQQPNPNPGFQQPQNQYNNNPQQPQFNNQAPPAAPFNPPQQQQPQQPGGGWGAPGPQNQYQPQGFGQNPAPAPPQNYQPPPQNYQPPPINPTPFPNQQNYQPQQPQQPVPLPNQGYRPPPPAPAPAPQQPYQPQRPNNNAYQPQPQPQPPQQPQPYTPPQAPQQPQPYTPPQAPRPRPQQSQPQPQRQPEAPGVPYPGCPAAMLCVQDDYCNTIGLIEESPVQLSAADRLHRVALMQCSEPMTGIVGVCCRDPNYKDPWPDMQGGGGMNKPDHQHHHPGKGQSQGQQKSPFFQPQQPPQGNHLASGAGGNPNPYSGQPSGDNGNNNYGWTRNRNNAQCNNLGGSGSRYNNPNKNRALKSVFSSGTSSSSAAASAESKQTIQVLEPCSSNELCISMSQCHSLNPEFMEKTGLNPTKFKNRTDFEPVKIKRCKYERSGVHYLCCKKPEKKSTTPLPTYRPFFIATTKRPSYSHSPSTAFTFGTTPKPKPFASPTFPTQPFSTTTDIPAPLKFTSFYRPSTTTTTKSSLITGVGLRFHAGLHTQKQRELNSKKPNPYKENEQPIVLISPTESITETPFTFGASNSFRFTTTTSSTTPLPSKPRTIPARVISSTRTFIPSTTPTPSFHSFAGFSQTPFFTITTTSTPNRTEATTPSPPTTTTTEGKVDISRIPVPVPLRKELRDDPPIGFIFKGEDLFVPEIQIPSQNYLVPTNDFEERTFPTEPPLEEEIHSSSDTTSLEGTTIYSILDDVNVNSNSHERG